MEYHNHHIIPRHMGGSDEPENLIRLTVAEHAEAHHKLWQDHGNINDYIAWKGLIACIHLKTMKGTRWFYDPTSGQRMMFMPGDQPDNWLPGMKKRKERRKRIRDLDAQAQRLRAMAKSGLNHRDAKLWTLKGPDNTIYYDVVLYPFCKERGLSPTALQENFRGATPESLRKPVRTGKSKGWIILSCKEKGN